MNGSMNFANLIEIVYGQVLVKVAACANVRFYRHDLTDLGARTCSMH